MYNIDGINASDYQKIKVSKLDGTYFDLYLSFRYATNHWYMSIQDGAAIINWIKVTTNPNILRQFKNVLNFGIACETDSNSEPRFIEDFINDRARLYLLLNTDITTYEASLTNG